MYALYVHTSLATNTQPTRRLWLALPLFFIVTYAAAYIGAATSMDGVRTWYTTINKPSWTPPGWLFGPVWSILYTMIAVAGFLAWRASRQRTNPKPLVSRSILSRNVMPLFFIQLVLNALWSWLFFGLHRPGIALIDIVLLLISIFACAFAMRAWSRTAFILMLPYAAWVTFATALNATMWWLNR